jgi:hypothetical protein
MGDGRQGGSRQSEAALGIKVGDDATFRAAAHRNRLTNHETVGGSGGGGFVVA